MCINYKFFISYNYISTTDHKLIKMQLKIVMEQWKYSYYNKIFPYETNVV